MLHSRLKSCFIGSVSRIIMDYPGTCDHSILTVVLSPQGIVGAFVGTGYQVTTSETAAWLHQDVKVNSLPLMTQSSPCHLSFT